MMVEIAHPGSASSCAIKGRTGVSAAATLSRHGASMQHAKPSLQRSSTMESQGWLPQAAGRSRGGIEGSWGLWGMPWLSGASAWDRTAVASRRSFSGGTFPALADKCRPARGSRGFSQRSPQSPLWNLNSPSVNLNGAESLDQLFFLLGCVLSQYTPW